MPIYIIRYGWNAVKAKSGDLRFAFEIVDKGIGGGRHGYVLHPLFGEERRAVSVASVGNILIGNDGEGGVVFYLRLLARRGDVPECQDVVVLVALGLEV